MKEIVKLKSVPQKTSFLDREKALSIIGGSCIGLNIYDPENEEEIDDFFGEEGCIFLTVDDDGTIIGEGNYGGTHHEDRDGDSEVSSSEWSNIKDDWDGYYK